VVNPANPVTQLSQADLLAIFTGTVSSWADLAKGDCPGCAASSLKAVQPYVYAEGDDLAQVFNGLFPSITPKLPNGGILAPNPGAVLQAVAADPQAIGYLPIAWVDSTVKTVKISDLPAGALRFPLVLSAAAEPQGARLSWLRCVQNAVQ
jgi:phosphate transport system substrate-binding protein